MAGPRLLALALLLGVGGVGLLGGVVLERSLLTASPAPEHAGPGVVRTSGAHDHDDCDDRKESSRGWHQRVATDLDLSAEQSAELERLLEARRVQVDEAMGEVRPRMKEIVARTHEEILALLTPEQRERFERIDGRRNGRDRR